MGHLEVADIGRATCEVFLADLVRQAPSIQMVEKTIKALRAILRAGVEWGWLAQNGAADLRLPRPDPSGNAAVRRVLTAEQLSDFFVAASPNPAGRVDAPHGGRGRPPSWGRSSGSAGRISIPRPGG